MSAQTLLALRGLADHLAVVIADMEASVALPGGDTPAEGSGGDAMEGVPAHQAQGGDVPSPAGTSSGGDGAHLSPPAPSVQPTPQAGDQEPAREAGVEPATDEDIAYYAAQPGPLSAPRVCELVARVWQEQDRADGWKGSCRDWEDKALTLERERDEAVARAEKAERERDEAVARAELAETAPSGRPTVAQEPEPLARRIAVGEADLAAGRTITLEELRERIDVAQEPEPTPSDGVVMIARCPEHGLNGCRTECFVCGGPVEQVPMVPLGDAPSQEPASESNPTRIEATASKPEGGSLGVEPATDEQIAELVEHVRGQDRYENSVTNGTFLTVAARVRQEQARADSEERGRHQIEDERDEAVARAEKAERERDEAVARADELKGISWRADAATRKAQERAEAAEAEVARMRPVVQAAVAEVARMRPVVEAAVDWDMAMADLDDLAVAVTEYRAARKEGDRG